MTTRIGFIGGHGHHYLSGAIADGAEAAWCPGYDDADAARSRAQHHNAAWFDDAAAMYDRFRPDVVNVGTMYAHQLPFVVEAVRRGVPVVCDKPVAATWDGLAELEEAAGVNPSARSPTPPADGLTSAAPPIITEFDFRSRATFRAARAAVERGDVGKPILATAQKSYRFGDARPAFYKHREDYGSTMLWIASHGLDAVRYVTGLPIRACFGLHGNLSRPDYGSFEDHCVATLRLEGGATAVVHADYLRPAAAPTHGDDRLRVAGSAGVLEIRDRRCLLITADAGPRDITDTADDSPPHAAMLRAALEGDTTHYSTAATLELARVLLTCRDAADKQRWMKVEATAA